MLLKTLYILALSTLIISSCKPKTEHTIVQGYVKTYGSETTHEGIEIELRQDGSLPLDITTSNADGWYQLEGEFEENKRQYLYSDDPPPLHQSLDNQPFDNFEVASGGVQRIDLEIPPYSWINIHFKNVAAFDQNDRIGYTGNNTNESIVGALADEFRIIQRTGNTILFFEYGVVKNDIRTRYTDTIGYVPAFDTVDFEVFY
jgi:hypothetical protein